MTDHTTTERRNTDEIIKTSTNSNSMKSETGSKNRSTTVSTSRPERVTVIGCDSSSRSSLETLSVCLSVPILGFLQVTDDQEGSSRVNLD